MKIPFRNTDSHYGAVAQLLHWLVVVGILMQFIWSWRIDETDSIRQQYALVVEHKSIGMTVLVLVLVRIGWRLFNRPPRLPAAMNGWERLAASATHWLLYGLILAMPLSGWAWSSAAGYGAEFFGLLEIPDLVGENERLADTLEDVHEWLGRAILAIAGVHVLAALRHHFWLKDSILKRMLPGWNQ
ncbi:MAG: cytochrome b [Wenzhouxiangellaceae bacterium]|nr:cytochrome b [Wenzhouxiangellaceae bacterium]